jgi:hypothetical protein
MKFAAGPALRALNEAAGWWFARAADWPIALSLDASGSQMPQAAHAGVAGRAGFAAFRGLDGRGGAGCRGLRWR